MSRWADAADQRCPDGFGRDRLRVWAILYLVWATLLEYIKPVCWAWVRQATRKQ